MNDRRCFPESSLRYRGGYMSRRSRRFSSAIGSVLMLVVASGASAQTPTPTPSEPDPCTQLDKRDPSCCGNGRVELGFEQCDDGNNFDGDGCSSVCTLETEISTRFPPILISVQGLSIFVAGLAPTSGSVTFTKASPQVGPGARPIVAVRSFSADPIELPQTGILCVRGTIPEDEGFGPGNVGQGRVGAELAPANSLSVTINLQQWLDPEVDGHADVGTDGVACTEDDPGLADASTREAAVILPLPAICNGDLNNDGHVTVDELVNSVNHALSGCPAP